MIWSASSRYQWNGSLIQLTFPISSPKGIRQTLKNPRILAILFYWELYLGRLWPNTPQHNENQACLCTCIYFITGSHWAGFQEYLFSCLAELALHRSEVRYTYPCFHMHILITMLQSYLNHLAELLSKSTYLSVLDSVTILRDRETRISKGVAWIQYVE